MYEGYATRHWFFQLFCFLLVLFPQPQSCQGACGHYQNNSHRWFFVVYQRLVIDLLSLYKLIPISRFLLLSLLG